MLVNTGCSVTHSNHINLRIAYILIRPATQTHLNTHSYWDKVIFHQFTIVTFNSNNFFLLYRTADDIISYRYFFQIFPLQQFDWCSLRLQSRAENCLQRKSRCIFFFSDVMWNFSRLIGSFPKWPPRLYCQWTRWLKERISLWFHNAMSATM